MYIYKMKPKMGSHTMADGSVITSGMKVTVDTPAILHSVRDKFELINEEHTAAVQAQAAQPTAKLELVFVGNDENPDQYDVVNSETGAELNVNPLGKQDACALAGIEYVADVPAEGTDEGEGDETQDDSGDGGKDDSSSPDTTTETPAPKTGRRTVIQKLTGANK